MCISSCNVQTIALIYSFHEVIHVLAHCYSNGIESTEIQRWLLIQANLINVVSLIVNKLVPREDCALLAVFNRTSTCLSFPWDCT